MIKFIIIVVLIFMGSPLWAANYYIAQTAAGSEDASSCANAKASSWNWASPSVTDGDIVYLCGTFTSTLTIPKGGTSAAITIKSCANGEANCGTGNAALFQSTVWGYQSTAAITASSKNHLIIDGNSVGIIENTANGSPAGTVYSEHPTEPDGSAVAAGLLFANSTASSGIYLSGGDNIEIKNWTIRNIYQRVAYTNDQIAGGTYRPASIYIENLGDNVLIHNNTLQSAYYGVRVWTSAGTDTIKVYNNNIYNFVVGTDIGQVADVTLTNIYFYGNTLSHTTAGWSEGCWGTDGYQCAGGDVWHHTDGYHTASYATATTGVGPFYIHGNNITANLGSHVSSFIYLEKKLGTAYFYNNVLVSTVPPSNAHINFASTINGSVVYFYNNTIKGTGLSGGNGIIASSTGTITVYGYGNIFNSLNVGWYFSGGTYTYHLDYNDFYTINYPGWTTSGKATLGAWQTETSDEANSLTVDPEFVSAADFSLQATSDLINAFPTASAPTGIFNTDILNNVRPSGAAWDIGAYEFGAGGDETAPSVTISTTDPSNISTDALTVTGTASDAVGVSSCKYRLGSAPDAGNGTACTGTTSWSCSTTGYSTGANTLYVGCTDAAGNWGSDSITVNYTPNAYKFTLPTGNISFPAGGGKMTFN